MKTKVSDRKALPHLAVRILTLPPIVIGVTLLLMYASAGLLTRRELLLCEVSLLVIPLAAYPLREIFHIGKDRRRGQRGTALVCSAVGYLCGFLWRHALGSSISCFSLMSFPSRRCCCSTRALAFAQADTPAVQQLRRFC